MQLRNKSQISTNADPTNVGGNVAGGNIAIDSKLIVATPNENSDITANAFRGQGGNIQISAQSIFGIEQRQRQSPQSDITASSDLGIDGTVQINTPDVYLNRGLVPLPVELVDVSGLIATSCVPGRENEFTITGRGGLPPNPSDRFSTDTILTGWATLEKPGVQTSAVKTTSNSFNTPTQIVEARSWEISPNGKVMLTASNVSTTSSSLQAANCQDL